LSGAKQTFLLVRLSFSAAPFREMGSANFAVSFCIGWPHSLDSEGRQRAQRRGVKFGRKPRLTVHQQQEALARRAAGEALVDIARSYAVSHSTISRLS